MQSILLQPILLAASVLIILLTLTRVPYSEYAYGTSSLSFLVGPATVALAVPLFRQARAIRRSLKPALASIAIGALLGLVLPPLIVRGLGGSMTLALTMAPKSATTPIAMEISSALGGSPELTAVLTVLTGMIGALIGPPVLRALGFTDPRLVGLVLGISSHAIGTAQMVRESDTHGSFSGFAMALTGIATALWSLPFYN